MSQALQRDESNWAVHKWYAITVSLTSAFDGTKAAIKQSFVVKEHFLRAAELNPHDATTRHALGCWYWEVASLSWAMRKVAAAVFASPPTGTFDEALAHFSLAESCVAVTQPNAFPTPSQSSSHPPSRTPSLLVVCPDEMAHDLTLPFDLLLISS